MLSKATSCLLLSLLFIIAFVDANGQNTQQALMRLLDSVNAPQNGPVRSNRTAASFTQSGVNNRQASFQPDVASSAIYMRQNTICRDTSERSFLVTDTLLCTTSNPIATADGNYLVSGWCLKNYSPYREMGGFLLKFDGNGNVLWHKHYDSLNPVNARILDYERLLELQDGTVLLVGFVKNAASDDPDIIFTKTTSSGNLLWTKCFNSRLRRPGTPTTIHNRDIQQMKQDPFTGEVYVTIRFVFGTGLIRMNSNTGSVVWSKSYGIYSGASDGPFGIDIKANEIKLVTKYLYNFVTHLCLYRINKATGDTISTKVVSAVDTTGYKQQMINIHPMSIRNNGNYLLSGTCFAFSQPPGSIPIPMYHASVAEMDSNFNFVQAYVFRNTVESNVNYTKISIYPDGSGYFTMLHNFSGYTGDTYSISFKDGQILKQRKQHHSGYVYADQRQTLQLANDGNMVVRIIVDSLSLPKIEVMKIHRSDTASYCLGENDNSTNIVTLNYIPDVFRGYDSVRSNIISESRARTLVEKNLATVKQPGCFQVSTCDSLQLITAQPTICQSQTLQIIARKNRGCGSSVLWNYNIAAVSSAVRVNDSTIAFQFNAPWSGYIYGSIQGCTTIIDSVYISVVQSPASLHLGPDTVICPGNTIVLNAHAGYTAYQWQNGSTDSVFTVTGPGTYHISVTDACSGAIYKDTVVVSLRPQAPISAGPDRIKCNNDTRHLNAPAGFINYAWSPAYNINALNGASVVVNPAVDTAYILKAEKTPGCFAMDTVRITVFHSPAIQLGPDTSLCAGQAITVSAGTGFAAYQWSNGSTGMQNTFNAAGTYIVTGTTAQGCTSYDTVRILNVYPLPNVGLNHNHELCTGITRTLDAGAFATYRWQDGSAGRTFTAQGTGTYYVQVTDSHGCTGTDTSTITTLLPLPNNFLPADTAICQYETLTLQPLQTFTSYLWSTNSTLPTAMASTAGTYWLQVRDNKGCAGADSITLRAKECLKGLFVPSAFTPNNDGKNDRLKALLFGQVKRYEFNIYNRFGQPVFSTKDAAAAWDGMIHGEPQTAGVYVWICTYQLSGEQSKTERGTVVLIR